VIPGTRMPAAPIATRAPPRSFAGGSWPAPPTLPNAPSTADFTSSIA